jgi:hypothetical protein
MECSFDVKNAFFRLLPFVVAFLKIQEAVESLRTLAGSSTRSLVSQYIPKPLT